MTDLPKAITDADAEHHSRAFAGMFETGAAEVPTPPSIAARNDKQPKPIATRHSWDYAVKSWPQFFSKMITGQKLADMRDKRDRNYAIGDQVLLCEYDPFGGGYSGRMAIFEITHIISNDTPCAMSSAALDNDFAVLSVKLLEVCS
jgi:hypothetical protein